MATTVNKEIWLPAIEEAFYSEWGILNQLGKDDSLYVDSKQVHIPNAGAIGTLLKNNSSYPVGVGKRDDTVNTYDIDSYQMPPVRIGRFDTKDLTYDKTVSVVRDQVGTIGETIKFNIFVSWYPGKQTGKFVETSADPSTLSEAPSSTTKVFSLGVEDVVKAKKILDVQKVPVTGRILLLPPSMFHELHLQLLNNFTINDNDGLMMFDKPFMGFKVVMQPEVINVQSNGTVRAYGATGTTTDLQVGLAYQKDQVSFAKGQIYTDFTRSAGYYGDTVESEAWAGGKFRRNDYMGIVPIIQKAWA